MAWVKLDDNFAEHPKILRAGAEGLALWVASLAYCNRQKQRDGFVPKQKVPLLYPVSNLLEAIARLVEAKLWEPVAGGYRIHDYHDYQPSEALSAKRAAAGRRGGLHSGEARRKQTGSKAEAFCLNPVPVPVQKISSPSVRASSVKLTSGARARARDLESETPDTGPRRLGNVLAEMLGR